MIRRLAAAVTITAAVLLTGVVTASPAAALVEACRNVPDPVGSELGPITMIDPGPENPRQGEEATLYEQYGPGVPMWPDYDPGCEPSMTQGPSNFLANGSFHLLQMAEATVPGVVRLAFNPDTLANLEPVQRVGAQAFGESALIPLLGLSLMVLSLWMAKRAFHGEVAENATALVWAAIIVTAGVVAMLWPTVIAPKVDAALTGGVGHVNAAVASGSPGTTTTGDLGSDVGASLHRAISYNTWCAGMFGRYSGETAETYCPQLYDASRYTYAEQEAIKGDPAAAEALREEKQAQFEEVAEQVKAADPEAYEWLAGHHNLDRWGYTLLGGFGLLAAGLFPIWSGLLMLFALVVVRFALVSLPLLALIGIHPNLRHVWWKVVNYAISVVLAAALFGSFCALAVATIGALLSPSAGLHPFAALLLMGVTTIALIKVSKPLRATKMLTRRRKKRRKKPRHAQGTQQPPTPQQNAAAGAAAGAATAAAGAPRGARLRTVVGAAARGAARGGVAGATTGPAGAGAAAARGAAAAAFARYATTAGQKPPAGDGDPGPVYDTSEPTRPVNLTARPMPQSSASAALPAATVQESPAREVGTTHAARVSDPSMRLYRPGDTPETGHVVPGEVVSRQELPIDVHVPASAERTRP